MFFFLLKFSQTATKNKSLSLITIARVFLRHKIFWINCFWNSNLEEKKRKKKKKIFFSAISYRDSALTDIHMYLHVNRNELIIYRLFDFSHGIYTLKHYKNCLQNKILGVFFLKTPFRAHPWTCWMRTKRDSNLGLFAL